MSKKINHAAALQTVSASLLAAHSPAEPYLIGVSGGCDSVALLHLLTAHRFKALVVCHLDHALREESADEARFVHDLAKGFGLTAAIDRENVRARAKRTRQSIETAAREARYEFFARVARERDCPSVFLAHHADDQVETFLFNLFRGAGPAGLAGMREETKRIVEGVELRLLRPLLGISRMEIDAYLAEHALSFREDPSNLDPKHTRNRLRHELLPALEDIFGRDIRPAILRTAELLRGDDEVLRTQLGEPAEELSVPALRALPDALQRRHIHAWLKERGVPGIGFDEVERVRTLLTARPAKVNLPSAFHARRRARRIFLEKATPPS